MTWKGKVGWAAALLLAAGAVGRVDAQMSADVMGANVSISSFAQADWAFSTASKPNPYNSHSLSTKGATWNQMAYRFESLAALELSRRQSEAIFLDSFRFFVRPRFYSDMAPWVGNDGPEVNLFDGRNGGRYPGNGWAAQTIGQNEWILDAAEAYVDMRTGPLKLRLGKQQIAWGTALFLRSLDAVNSLDLRRHSIFDIIGNEYADQRIAIWTANATVDLPSPVPSWLSDLSANAFISPDFMPWNLSAAGSTYNIASSQVLLTESKAIQEARERLIYGGVLKGNLNGVDLTFNYLSTPNTLGAFTLIPATGPNAVNLGPGVKTPFIYDTPRGVNSCADFFNVADTMRLSAPGIVGTLMGAPYNVPAGIFDPSVLCPFLQNTPVDVTATRVFPREHIFGGSASYYMQPIYEFPGAGLINGTLFKFEGTYTPNKQFTNPSLGSPIEVGELNFAVEMEKQVRWMQSLPSAFILLEYWFRSRGDFVSRYLPFEDQNKFQVVGGAIQQGVWGNRIRIDNTLVIDVAGPGTWYQPGILYKPRDFLEMGFYYNYFQGTSHDTFGALKTMDEMFTKATYKF